MKIILGECIHIGFTLDQSKQLVQLLDIAVKSGGLLAAEAALPIVRKIVLEQKKMDEEKPEKKYKKGDTVE